MKQYFDLTGSVAVITGATSPIGEEMALALANQGCTIISVARGREKLEAVTKKIRERCSVDAAWYTCDVTNPIDVDETIDEILHRCGRIDILVNNAGTGTSAPAERVTDEQFGAEMNVDLFGNFRVMRSVVSKAMIPMNYGRIINVASVFGIVGNKFAESLSYQVAKGSLLNMTRALAAEWGRYGITVNAICPGYIRTPDNRNILDAEDFKAYFDLVVPSECAGDLSDLDTTVIYLASPSSSYVTGVSIPVDGGYTAL